MSETATPRKRLTAAERREIIETAATEVFAQSGYHGASMDEIARRSGVSVPVLYDHFESKLELHKRLLERYFGDLRNLWRDQLAGEDPPAQRIPRAIDAWFAYSQTHPYAWRMLFRDTSGDPEVEAIHLEVAAASRAAAIPLLASAPGGEQIAGSSAEQLEMAWEVVRSVLQGLAMWWYDHQHVPREDVVAAAMNALWIGLERLQRGEAWRP